MSGRNLYKRSNEEIFDDGMDIETFFKNYKNMTIEDLKEDLNEGIDEGQDNIGPGNKKINKDIDKAQKDLNKEFDKILDMVGDDTKIVDLLPGSDTLISDFEEQEEVEAKTYESDRALEDFCRYVQSQYPSQTPKHDGQSLLGCERAIAWLQRLSNEISTNIRNDVEGILDSGMETLSDIQEAILTDILVLKDHMKKLKSMLPEKVKNRKKAEQEAVLEKFASTPNNMVITITPFVRAITGILINSTVSAGKPFEDVYDYLIEKYEISEREQLEILQVLMDMGQPIFKDRGAMPGSVESKDTEEAESKLKGVDFITNYFG